MKKDILAVIISVGVISIVILLSGTITNDSNQLIEPDEEVVEEDEDIDRLVDCLNEQGVVIFGASWCPACGQLADSFGGYDVIDSIYVECGDGTEEEAQRCAEEAKTEYVPEIQIDGELYEGPNDPNSLASEVGCEI